jgi:hypothetical protein
MRRSIALVLILSCLSGPAFAADKTVSKKRSAEEEKKLAETRKLISEKKLDLNGSRWELTLRSADPKIQGSKDTFVFQDGIFRSENYAKRGFPPTNYTVSVPEGAERGVWETMQSLKGDLIFIRGEWEKDLMQGVVTEQLEGGKKVKEYSFSSAPRQKIPASSSEEKTALEGSAPGLDAGPASQDSSKALVSKEAPKADPKKK